MDWIHVAQDREYWRTFVNTVMTLVVPQTAGNFLRICIPGGLSRACASM
jgi:hypothetical protein